MALALATAAMLVAVSHLCVPAASAASALTWAAPALDNPTVIDAAPGRQVLNLNNGRDYVVNITAPLTDAGGLVISGGRNVVVRGGEIRVPTDGDGPARRGLYLKNQTGVMHVEGIKITGDNLAEGINLDQRLGATVQLQNIDITMVHGTQAGHHADLIQTWAGPKTLRVDRLRGATNYQGFFLLPHQLFPEAVTEGWDLRNIDIEGTPEAGYGIWAEDNHGISTSNVFVSKTNGSTAKAYWPNAGAFGNGAKIASAPSSVAPLGNPGMGYVSPGAVVTNPGTPAPTVPVTTAPVVTPPVADSTPNAAGGYWQVASDGGIFSFGKAKFYGSTGGMRLNKSVVGMAGTPSGKGYWLVASDGGIFAFGDAKFFGSTGSFNLNKPVVGMASTPTGNGYWLVASDGGIFAFGDAKFFGSTGSIQLNKPVVGMSSTPGGFGYQLVASDGGVFSFGDARFFGSTGSLRLNKPVVSMATTPSGNGYWMVAADGGIFAFGDAKFFGSGSGKAQGQVTTMAASASGKGYTLHSNTGWVGAYGDASVRGFLTSPLNAPVVAAASVR